LIDSAELALTLKKLLNFLMITTWVILHLALLT
jgi:hypothetical protein